MEQKLAKGVRGIVPSTAANRIAHIYQRGRFHFMKLRYGSPAPDARIIAITGAAGKTTTAQLIMNLLLEAGHSVAVYDPAVHGDGASSLWRGLQAAKKQSAEFIVIEVSPGLVKSGALDTLTLNAVVAVNSSLEARLLLGRAVDYAVIPDDHESGVLAVAEHQIVSFGEGPDADVKIESSKLFRKGTEISLVFDHHTTTDIATHLVGHANVFNVTAAVATAYILGVPLDTVPEGVARLEAVPGNFEYVKSDEPFITIIDGASSEKSAEQVVASAKILAKRRLIVALALKKPHSGFLARVQHEASRLVVVSSQANAPSNVEVVGTPEEARAIAERGAKKDDVVVLVGKPFIMKDL